WNPDRWGDAALVQLRWSITLGGPDDPLIGAAGAPVLVAVQLLLHTSSHPGERSRLAVVVDGGLVAAIVAVEALHELRSLGHLALEDAPVIGLVADDVWSEEQQSIRPGRLRRSVAETPAEQRQRSHHRE